jgi:hypothetical protein
MHELHVTIPDSNITAALILISVNFLYSRPTVHLTSADQPILQQSGNDEICDLVVRGALGMSCAIDIQRHEMVRALKEKLFDREGIP